MKNVLTKNCDVLLIGYEEMENLGLRSIAGFLTKHSVQVRIEPYKPLLKENILSSIRELRPKIVGFSLIFQRMLFDFADLINYLRQNDVTAHFTMGGHFPTVEFRETLEIVTGLDSVIRCEGEQTISELFKHLDQPNSWEQIKGLAFRRDGKIVVTPPRPLIQNLDDLPFPVRNNVCVTHRGIGMSSIIGSRGCYYNCSFCSIRQFYNESQGPKRRSRSPSNVVQEMEQLFHEHGIRIFIFEDDDFVIKTRLHRQWIEDFIQGLKKKKIAERIVWRISCRVDDVDAELIAKMMDVGLISVYLGIESGSNQGLMAFNKRYTVDDIFMTLGKLRELKMPFEFGFMILNPDSTFAKVKEDIAFLKEIGASGQAIIHFTKMIPYAGTPIAVRLKNEGRLKGTIVSPDYTYEDPRLELLQLFFTQAFHFRNFDNSGLVERLRHAKFDAIVLNKFFSKKYDTKSYTEAVRDLIRQCNAQCLETMSLAVNFMEKRDEEGIIDNWQFLQSLVKEEKDMELHLTSSLDWLMNYYSSREKIFKR